MKKILFQLLLISNLSFGQATGFPIANKPSGGSIGTAANTVDKVSIFNVNQTTAGQTLTVPNLTANTTSKIIYIGNTGSVSFILSPGCNLSIGTGATLRWDGLQWNVEGCGNPTGTVGATGPTGSAGSN